MTKQCRQPIYNAQKFKEFCKQNGAPTLFDGMYQAMLPCRPDRTSVSIQESAERHAMVTIYMMCYSQSERFNWLQRDMSNFLHYHGMSDTGLYALYKMGLGLGHTTFYRDAHRAKYDHDIQLRDVIQTAIAGKKLMVIIIDDYTNIHTRQRSNFTEIAHMATVLLRIFEAPAVPASVDGHPVNDPVGVNTQALLNGFAENMWTVMSPFVSTAPNTIHQQYFNPTNERQRLTTHMYGNNNDVRQLRCVENAHLIDCVPQALKSFTDYQHAAAVYLYTPLLEYLREHCVVVPGDWPSQFYQRQMSYSANIRPPALRNTLASMGPLHVSLNGQENVVIKFMPFFKKFYQHLFKKQLAKKPNPWRISLLLELVYGGWTLVRQPVNQRLHRCKDMQIRTLLNLLENYAPLTLSIYSVLFKSNSYDEYFKAMQQVWVMFWCFRRRHYDKAPLVWLANMLYLKNNQHPMFTTIRDNLHILDEYPVENFHSLLRARTELWDNAETIQKKAIWIDQRRQQLHNFSTWFVPPRQCQLKRNQLRYLKFRAAQYLLELINNICTHPFSGEELPRTPRQSRTVTRWRLRELFGDLPVNNQLLPLGFQFEGNGDLEKALAATGQKLPFSPRQNVRCDRTGCATSPNDLVVLFPCGHSFHRSCLAPHVEFCFICRTGLLLAVRQKAEIARTAIFNPAYHEEQNDDDDDDGNDGDDNHEEDPLHVAELTDEQAAANLQGLLNQVAALPPIQLL